jgi:hypothetical protein
MQYTTNIWLANPANALSLDYVNPENFYHGVHLATPLLDMRPSGWVLLGTADIQFHLTKPREDVLQDALTSTKNKLAELDAKHEQVRNGFLDLMNKMQSLEWNGKVGS